MASLKPQDVLVALKLVVLDREPWTFPRVASALGMSGSEVHQATRRLASSRLYQPDLRRVSRAALAEFLIHGAPYAFPVAVGPVATGMATATSAAPLRGAISVGADGELVWPRPFGRMRGHSVTPLYRSAPIAAERDEKLHELLALVDALRVGRARERHLAARELRLRLDAGGGAEVGTP